MKRVTFEITYSRLSGVIYGFRLILSSLFDWRGECGITFDNVEVIGDIEVSGTPLKGITQEDLKWQFKEES